MGRIRQLILVIAWLGFSALACASPYRGVVTFGGLPLPGAIVTASQNGRILTAVTDENGAYQFDDLADGQWTIDIAMQCFEKIEAAVTVAPQMPAGAFDLKLLPVDKLVAESQAVKPAEVLPPAPTPALKPSPGGQQAAQGNANSAPAEIPKAPEENEQSADGFLVQGSVNNAATSQYATSAAFGNTRLGTKGLYTGGFVAVEDNSALDSRTYSLSGVRAAKPGYNNFTGVAILQGPIKIPHIMERGPTFFAQYQWTRNTNEIINTGLVPTQDERNGNLSGLTNVLGQPLTIYQPGTNTAYPGNQVPVSPQAAALLAYYPLPNIANVSGYNYQAPVENSAHQDAPQFRLDKTIGRRDEVYGNFAAQSTRSDSVNLFGFVDHTGTLGINAAAHWSHRLKPRIFLFTNYTFSRVRTEVTPNFAGRINVSGLAGIPAGSASNLQQPGNLQDPADYGPPALGFSSGFFGLSDGNSAFNRNRSDSLTASALIYHGKHNLTIGGEFRRQEYNDDAQQNPRGAFGFTGAATAGATSSAATSATSGSDLADFLIGVPDTSSIAFGNANKDFRETVDSLYFTDDWRILPILTINAGARWDYSAPMTELFGRLVNIDAASGFTSVAPVLGSVPVGSVSGQHFPSSLIRPDRTMFEPRIGITWRPIPASTVVIRAGYGIYPDTSVYQNIIQQLAQQAPLSKSLTVENSAACPQSLATGFSPCSAAASDVFGIDPNFRVGYAQKWSLGVQRDMPFAMQLTATYLGTKGTHGPQEILPNSYPLGEANPCPGCPSGFIYETSGGNSIRNEGQLQVRRRLRSGFAASLAYTYSKSIDDDAYLGGQGHATAGSGGQTQSANLANPNASVAQNWLAPRAERSLSSFDQRNLLSVQAQYTSGQGLEGGTLLGGWRGRALKEWTVQSTLSYGSGFPETPIFPAAVPGTGDTGIIRPDLTGAPIYGATGNAHLNAAAFAAPAAGQWGTAGRFSITGPDQLTLNSQLARTFRPHGKLYLDVAVNATNTLNHPAFSSWNNAVTSTQFGLPVSPGGMRDLQTTLHLRF